MIKLNVRKTAEELLMRYPDYYDTVYFEFIVEAVENTFNDFKHSETLSLEEIHKNIKENYI